MLLRNLDITNVYETQSRNVRRIRYRLEIYSQSPKRWRTSRRKLSSSRRQSPLRVFATTINKSRGQTFTKKGLFLERQIFSYGQLYVALSRVRNSTQLKIKAPGPSRRLCTLMSSLELQGLKNKPAFHTFPSPLSTCVLFPESWDDCCYLHISRTSW